MNNLENIIGYKYSDLSYLQTALTHVSYAKEYGVESYEKLEFLGDTVLQFAITNYIFKEKSINEGQLSKLRASLVSTQNLSNICDNMGITKYIKLGRSLKNATTSIKEDVIESIIASIYLDGGYDKANEFVLKNIIISIDNVIAHMLSMVDYKTLVQEYNQKSGKNTVKYVEISAMGKDNDKDYTMALYIDDVMVATATAKSKQKAESICAEKYYKEVIQK